MPVPWENPPPGQKPWEDTSKEITSSQPGTPQVFAGGAIQGALFDPVQGIGQLIEHATGHDIPIPKAVNDWFEDYKNKYTSTTAGEAGRIAGTVGSAFVPGGLIAKGAGTAGRAIRAADAFGAGEEAYQAYRAGQAGKAGVAEALRKPPTIKGKIAKSAGYGAAGGAVQPVDEGQGDFAGQKAGQIMGGALGGGILGAPGAGGAAATAAIGSSVNKFGFWPTMVGLSFLMPNLRALASHHKTIEAARYLSGLGDAIVQRPGAAYAAGRAATPFTAPAGEVAKDIYEENQ